MVLLAIGLVTCAATLAGGLLALGVRDRRQLVLGLSAGAVIGVAFFDLMPESLELAGATFGPAQVTAATATGFLLYMIIDRVVAGHTSRGPLAAASLSVHSFFDGVSIGLAFKASLAVGVVVAAGVVMHDLFDGINTVTVVLANDGGARAARRWLVVDAAAPLAGVAATFAISIGGATLGLALALFGGFFLYIGASELMPASARSEAPLATAAMTVLGALLLYLAVRIAQL